MQTKAKKIAFRLSGIPEVRGGVELTVLSVAFEQVYFL